MVKISQDSKISLGATTAFTLLSMLVGINDYVRSCIWEKCSHPSFIHNLTINWDGGWYQSVVTHGYSFNGDFGNYSNIAFFPGLPLIGRLAYLISSGNEIIYLTIIVIFNIVLLFLTIKCSISILYLISGKKEIDLKFRALLALLIASMPSILFYISLYSEPILLFGLIHCYYYSLRKEYLKASIFAGIASSAKSLGIVGLLIIMSSIILNEYGNVLKSSLKSNTNRFLKNLPKLILLVTVGLSGIIGFSIYQNITLGDPLAFVKIQQAWSRDTKSSLVAKSRNMFKSNVTNLATPQRMPEGRVTVGPENQSRSSKYMKALYALYNTASTLLIVPLFGFLIYKFHKTKLNTKGLPLAFMATLVTLLIPLSTGTFASMNRYSIFGVILLSIFLVSYCLQCYSSNNTKRLLLLAIVINFALQAIFMACFVSYTSVG